jgi:ArsR family transcriptional regulator, arsenate/arsenite/antimonite-responsive transcriptional repressor
MDLSSAVTHLTALAHESRLGIFRLLVRGGPQGLCVSDIGTRLKIAPTTLSFHLKELAQAKLIRARQDGRFVYYSADFNRMNALVRYLTEHCCEGQPCEVASESVTCEET